MQEKSIQASQLIGRDDIKKTRCHHGFHFTARIAPLDIKSFDLLTLAPIVSCDATPVTILYILDASFLLRHALLKLFYDCTCEAPLVFIGVSSILEW